MRVSGYVSEPETRNTQHATLIANDKHMKRAMRKAFHTREWLFGEFYMAIKKQIIDI